MGRIESSDPVSFRMYVVAVLQLLNHGIKVPVYIRDLKNYNGSPDVILIPSGQVSLRITKYEFRSGSDDLPVLGDIAIMKHSM